MTKQDTRKDTIKVTYTKYAVPAAVALLVGIVGFAGGVQYGKHHSDKAASASTDMQDQQGPDGRQFGRGGGGFGGQQMNLGTVSAVSADSITYKDQAGADKTFAINDATVVTNNRQAAAKADIKVGDTVAVVADSTDASQAARITINPRFGGNRPSSSVESNGSGDSTDAMPPDMSN